MERYKKTLKTRLVAIISGTAAFIAANFALMAFDVRVQGHSTDYSRGFQTGMATGFVILCIAVIIRYISVLRNEEKMKKLYVEETDERKLMIYQKSGSMGMNIVMAGLAAAAVFAAYFDFAVFVTLMCASLFVSLIRFALKLYYMNKY